MSCDNTKYNCGQIIGSGCVPYTGSVLTIIPTSTPNVLPCNANINDVISLFDTTLKKLMDSNNFTTLNVRCLTFNPATVTAVQLHQLEIDTICALQASLATLTTQVNSLNIANMQIGINLQCMSAAASSCATGTNIYPLIAILNVMVNQICALKAAVGI